MWAFKRSGESEVVHNNGTSRTRIFTGLLADTTYTVRVRARTSQGNGSWSSSREFTTTVGIPGAPGRPSISDLGIYTARSSWSAPSSLLPITRYDVGLVESGKSEVFYNNGTSRSITLTGLLPGKTYVIRVRARTNEGTGTWATTRTFTTYSTAGGVTFY